MIRRRVGKKIAVGYKTALKEKFAVLQIAAEVGGGQLERVREKAGVGREQSYGQTNLKERARWTGFTRGGHWRGLPPRFTLLGHQSITRRADFISDQVAWRCFCHAPAAREPPSSPQIIKLILDDDDTRGGHPLRSSNRRAA